MTNNRKNCVTMVAKWLQKAYSNNDGQ